MMFLSPSPADLILSVRLLCPSYLVMLFIALSALTLAQRAFGATYNLAQNNVGTDFLNNFDHETIGDPTNGRVYVERPLRSSTDSSVSTLRAYVDQATATSANLTFASGNSFIMRADSTTVLAARDPGRKSVRIKSKAAYTTHVIV